jgi:hypothetical protein
MTRNLLAIKLVPRHAYNSDSLYLDGKNHAMPSLYRDYFVAEDKALWPVLRQATPTNSTAGPLAFRRRCADTKIAKIPIIKKARMLTAKVQLELNNKL